MMQLNRAQTWLFYFSPIRISTILKESLKDGKCMKKSVYATLSGPVFPVLWL